jgi:hypothetical protein
MVVAGGIGIIPVPLFDQISIGALQAKMIYDLGQLYKVNIVDIGSKLSLRRFLEELIPNGLPDIWSDT